MTSKSVISVSRSASCLGVVEVVEEAVGGEDGQARVLERDEAGERVAVRRPRRRPRRRRCGRSRSGGGRRRSAAPSRRRASPRSPRGPPGRRSARPGGRCRRRRSTSPKGVGVEGGVERGAPGVARVEGEDRGEVVAGGARQPEAVLLRAGLGALVRADEAGAVVGRPATRARKPRRVRRLAVGARVVLP